jgi:multidrug efflux pump subunit AcrB
MSTSTTNLKGPIAYMAQNHVAANILMLILIIGGLLISKNIKQEVFPEFDLDMVQVSVFYPGAAPDEVEDSIVRPIELAVSGVENVKTIRATAVENSGSVTIEVIEGADTDQVVRDVRSEVDRILTFPEEAEKPLITTLSNAREVISLLVSGDASDLMLRRQAEQVRDDLLAMDGITQVNLAGASPYEIAVEISEDHLRKYNLTLNTVATLIRQRSLDMAGGSIKSTGGEILIRTTEKRYTRDEFAKVTVFTYPDGRDVTLGEIAEIRDEFADVDQATLLDDQSAIMVRVFRVGNQKPTDVAATVHEYVANQNAALPESVQLTVYNDSADILEQRMNLLMKNGLLGLILVVIILSIFLEIRLAMWVAMGIVISFLGAMIFLPALNVSINMISLFAFITILGVVVDDAIVVGENIYVHSKRNKSLIRAAIDGTREVATAVVFAGLTTTCAFGALLFIGGFMGNFMGVIPKIVLAVLAISLIEALFILPSHLSGGLVSSEAPVWKRIEQRRGRFDGHIENFVAKVYQPVLTWVRHNRYMTLAIAIAILLTTAGVFRSGMIKFTFMPQVEADELVVSLSMPPGTPYQVTADHAARIKEIGEQLIQEADAKAGLSGDQSNLSHKLVLLGQQLIQGGGPHGNSSRFSTNLAQVRFLLAPAGERTLSTNDLATDWKRLVGEIPGADQLNFRSDLIQRGADLEIELSHADYDILISAVERLKADLAGYAGTSEVSDSHVAGKRELRLRLRPEASSLGISERDLAIQVRSAFYGAEAMRIQRDQNEVKVMVRYPESDRRSMATIDRMRLRTPQGQEIPFAQAAYVDDGRGYSSISRTDRRRTISVTASVDREITNADEILSELRAGVLSELANDYPNLVYNLEGASRDQQESMASMRTAMMFGLVLIFSLLAIPFRSFLQPIIVMSVIPFGIVGATIGHLLFGFNLSLVSVFGMVALSGVVVNDSLVMIDFINRVRREGTPLHDAIMISGVRRFRPIIMTTFTTFFGLMPMIMEKSIQARFLVPMALSLGFGILFATGLTLLLVPTLYLVLEDIKGLFRREKAVATDGELMSQPTLNQ